ncbi:MAG: hypothetical protein KA004_18890 [Verrucomicrobiales bacterium]|nr:hypothetical protein [Verrucomicrobiales bacterium]
MRLFYACIREPDNHHFRGIRLRAPSLPVARREARKFCLEQELMEVSYRVREVPEEGRGWRCLRAGFVGGLVVLGFVRFAMMILS